MNFFEKYRNRTGRVYQLGDWLTGPTTAVSDDESRRNSRLIAVIVLLLLVVGSLERLVFNNVPLWVFPVLGVAYILSRTKLFTGAAIITVFTLSLPTYFAVIQSSDPNANTIALELAWMVFPLLISGLFFSVRGVIIFATSCNVGILLLPFLNQFIGFPDILLALNFVGAFSLLVIIIKYQRNRLEMERLNKLSVDGERLRLALDAAQMGMWDWDIVSDNLIWSQQAAFIFGLEQDVLSGTLKDFTATILPEDWGEVEQAITRAIAGETEDFRVEHRVILPDDHICWVEGRGQVYQDDNGRSARMTGITIDITARKQAEAQEINRKAWLEKVVELGKNVTQVKDWHTCLTTIHQSVFEGLQFERVGLFLYDEEQDVVSGSLGTTLTGEIEDISHFSRPADVEGNFREVLTAPRGFVSISKPGDRFNKPPDHALHKVQELVTVAVWGREKPVAILTVDNAITDRPIPASQLEALRIFAGYAGFAIENVRLLERLQASERNYREIFNATNEAIFIYDAQSEKLLDVNKAVTEMYGSSYEEMLSARPDKYRAGFEPYTAEYIAGYIQKSVVEGPQLFEWLARKQSGELFWVEIALKSTMINEQSCVLAVVRDITHRKEAEKALRSEHEFRTSIIKHAAEGLCVYHYIEEPPYLKFTEWNDRMTQITGYTMAQINRLGWSRSFFPDSTAWESVTDRIQKAQDGDNLEIEAWEIMRADGEKRILNITTSILEGDSGQSHVLALVNDVTDIKHAELEQQMLIRELEAKNTELERFTYTVSHDLKSPLISIRGFVSLLEQDALSGNVEQIKRDIGHIIGATDRMQTLLDELLELSRVGRLVNESESVSFSEIVQEAVVLVSGQIAARGVEIVFDSNLPMVFGDRHRLIEVVQNLLDNSVKFMGTQPTPRIEIGAEIEGEEVLCYVRDNGIGIEPEYHERIFELFGRLNQAVEGTGIGLALVKRIVEVHNGRIWVESEGNGNGTNFYFTLPRNTQ